MIELADAFGRRRSLMKLRTVAFLAALVIAPALPYAQAQRQAAATPTASGTCCRPR
jgi:hypothetical protein